MSEFDHGTSETPDPNAFDPDEADVPDALERRAAFAEALDRDKGVVSRDLQTLARLDVVEFEENGCAKPPRLKHAHVAVEPIV